MEHSSIESCLVVRFSETTLKGGNRSRFEQRFSGAGDDVGFRLREFARVGWSWREDGKFGLVLWDEVFLGFNETDWGAPSGLDQNRLFLGWYVKTEPNLRLEMGYLSLFVDRDQATLGHVLATTLFIPL